LVLGLFVAGGVAEAVVFAFRVVGGGVVEGCGVLVWRVLLCVVGGFGLLLTISS
jgi:hypothetical protein